MIGSTPCAVGAHLALVFGRPGVQALTKASMSGANSLLCPAAHCLGRRRHAVGPHPAVGIEILLAVELGAAAARLRVEAEQQLGVGLHLRVAVGVEQARMIGREDVRDAVAVPQDLGALGRRLGPGAYPDSARQHQRDDKGERES